jgi:hypothetical protein
MKSPGANAPWHKQSGEATGVLHVPRDGFWLVASYISLAGPTQTVPVDEQVKVTCYNMLQ